LGNPKHVEGSTCSRRLRRLRLRLRRRLRLAPTTPTPARTTRKPGPLLRPARISGTGTVRLFRKPHAPH